MQIKENLKNVISLFTMEFFSRLLGFLAVSYLANVMGKQSFGYINIAQAVLAYLLIVGQGGMNMYGTRKIIASTEPPEKTSRDVLFTKLILTVGSYFILLPVIYFLLPAEQFYIILVYTLFAFPYAFLMEWFFQGHLKMDIISIGRIIGMAVYLLLLILFVSSSHDIIFTGIAWTLGGVFNSAYLLIIYKKQGYHLGFNLEDFKFFRLIKNTFSLGVSSVISQVVSQFPIIFLGIVATASEAGLYSAAYKVLMLVLVLDRVFSALFFPQITAAFNRSPEAFEEMLKRVLRIISVMGLVVSVVVIVGSDYLMTLPFSRAFINASPIFRVLTGVFYFNLLCSVFTYAVIGMNRENIYTIALIYGIIAFLICVFPLTKYFGAEGSAAAYTIFQFVTFITMYYKLKTRINIQILRPIIIPAFISLIIIYILVTLTDINIIYRLLISFIAGAPLISY